MTMLRLTLREIRLITERLVQAHAAPPGVLASVRDCAMYSAVLPVAGFAGLPNQLSALRANAVRSLTLEEDSTAIVDGGGQHAWFAAPTVLDLAIERFRLAGRRDTYVRNVASPDELSVVAGLAEHHGLTASASRTGDGAIVRVAARDHDKATVLDRLRREGILVDAALWWPLYHASHDALLPDSFESRRHAGTIRVEADGRIVGRNDEDETDLAMLAADPSRLRPASTT